MKRQHTPPDGEAASLRPIVERKLKPDGSVREYPCDLLHLDSRLAVVQFVMTRGGAIFGTPIKIPPGSTSYGYFWANRPYNLYRMLRPGGTVIAHRFDALMDVQLGDNVISYRDLVLDWWVAPDGTLIEEDREELDSLVASGAVSARDAARANEAARQVFSRYRHIINEAEAIERRLRIGAANG